MLAYNEEKDISRTIRSLFEQSVFKLYDHGELIGVKWEVTVVPNGCTDLTAEIARNVLREICNNLHGKVNIKWDVIEIGLAGKSNAWNEFIHNYSNKDSEFVVMLDADIEFDNVDTILNTIKELQRNSHASVVVDLPLKDFVKKKNKSLVEKISIIKSRDTFLGDPGIAGSFYCARFKILREIWMPVGLPGEDGFLRAMIITNLFRSLPDPTRVVRADNSSHFYEGLTKVKDIYNHELRMIIGTTLNSYFCWGFLAFATDPNGSGAGHLIKSCLEHNPDWYRTIIRDEITKRGWWVLPRGMLVRKIGIRQLAESSQWPKKLLIVFVSSILYLPVMIVANYKLKKGAIGFW